MKIKDIYKGLKVMRNGITFDIDATPQDYYQFYFDNGFKDLFDIEKPKSAGIKPKKENEQD